MLLRKHILRIIGLTLLIRVGYVLFAITVQNISDELAFNPTFSEIIGLFKRHDSYWYERIHDTGYPEVHSEKELGWNDGENFYQSPWGFMPGYPLLVKSVSLLTGFDFTYSASIISILFSALAAILLYWLSMIWWQDAEKAYLTTLLFILMPFQYYLFMLYSESVYLTFLLGALLAVHYRKFWLMGFLLSGLVVMRANGIVMLIPVLVYLLENNALKFSDIACFRKEAIRLLIPFVLPWLTMSFYLFFQYKMTGDPFAYSTAQKAGWYREFTFPLFSLFNHGSFTVQFNSVYTLLFFFIAFLYRKQFPLSFNLIIWISLLLPLSAGTPVAMTRYISVIFPLFFIYTNWIKDSRNKWIVFSLGFVIQLWTFYYWLISDPFSQ